MRAAEYFRYARLTLSARKKATRRLVAGISFGLILIVPVLFLALSLRYTVERNMRAEPAILYANVPMRAERSVTVEPVNTNDFLLSAEDGKAGLAKALARYDTVYYEQLYAAFSPKFSATESPDGNGKKVMECAAGGKTVSVYNTTSQAPFAAVLPAETSDGKNFLPEKITKPFGGFYAEGMDKGFSGGGAGQVAVSEVFAEFLGIDPQSLYGETLTIAYDWHTGAIQWNGGGDTDGVSLSAAAGREPTPKDDYAGTVFLCREYEVVGIIKKDVTNYALYSKPAKDGALNGHILSNLLFFTDASMRLPGGGVLEPSLTYSYSEPPNGNGMRTVYTAATNNFSAAEFAALNRTYMATGFGVSSWKKVSGDGVSATKSLLAAAASTRELDGILRKIAGVTGDTKEGAIAKYTSWTIEKFYDIKETVGYVTAGFLALGGFVLAVSVINMIVSFLHGLDMRENYLGILRAMGATQKDIPKFFLAEVFTVLFYAFFIIIVVSVPLCIFMTELLAPVYNAVNYAQNLPLTVYLGLQFIPLALLATGLLLAAFGFALAYALSYKKSKLPVTELLRQ